MLFSPCVVTARALTARSVLDQPLARRHRIDARRVRELAGVARCGDLGIRRVLELPALADLSTTTAPQLRLPDGAGWRLGQALGHALEQGVRLWLCEVAAEAVPLITRTIGDGLVHVVSLPGPIDDDAAPCAVEPNPAPAPAAPGAVPAPALLLVTHDLAAAALCDEIVVLHQGRVIERGPARRVITRPEHPVTRAMCTAAREETLAGALAAIEARADITDHSVREIIGPIAPAEVRA